MTDPATTDPAPDWSGLIPEDCPHCQQPHPAAVFDQHVATAHADMPPCNARIDGQHGQYTCVLRAGHPSGHGEYGHYHVSPRRDIGRTIWTDTAPGATPHHEDQP